MTSPPVPRGKFVEQLQLVGGLVDGYTIGWHAFTAGEIPPAIWWRDPAAPATPPPAGMDVVQIGACGFLALPNTHDADTAAVNAPTGSWTRFRATFELTRENGHHLYRMERPCPA